MPPRTDGLLRDARVYLSGPMDFVASRAAEKKAGWRHRVGEFLHEMGVIVFDPWEKPEVRGMHEYGREGEATTDARHRWTYARGATGAKARASLAESFWPAMHVDLRMVDTSDFVICYCPTNIYSVGTPHEIIVARQERKPVLFVSPYVSFTPLRELRERLRSDRVSRGLLEQLVAEVPIKENPNASPSLWYMPLIGGESFFDGFGFDRYRSAFGWPIADADLRERENSPERPLLPFLEELNHRLPRKWDRARDRYVDDDDWLIWNLKKGRAGPDVTEAYTASATGKEWKIRTTVKRRRRGDR